MKTFAKPFFNALIILVLCCISFSLFAQDCNIYDPLMEYDFELPDPDGCCQIVTTESTIYYAVDSLEALFEADPYCGSCDLATNPYKITNFVFPGGTWAGSMDYCGYTQLADSINAILSSQSPPISTTFQAYSNGVYAENVGQNDGFGGLKLYGGSGSCTGVVSPEYEVETTVEECDSTNTPTMPVIDPDSIGENAPTPENMTLLEIPGYDDFTTNDITSGDELLDATGNDTLSGAPSLNAIGQIFNAVAASGALQSGTSCTNINCFDLSGLADSLDSGEMAAAINDSLTNETVPNGYDTWSEFLSSSVADSLEEINLGQLLNDNLGFSIPNLPCDSMISFPLSGEKDPSRSLMVNDITPSTNADQDFFGQAIAGLGLDGPGAATPSPSAMSMIEKIKGGVNLYNGSQSTSIPLYTIQANDLSVPISLSSSNNGVKVNDMGSLVGQNWNLDAGGTISRIVKGLPDEYSGTTNGLGRGRIYKLTPLFEFPSNIGLDIKFTIIDDLPCPNIKQQIFTFDGLKKQVYKTPDNRVMIYVSWTPMRGNKINCTMYIKVYSYLNIVSLYLKVGFEVGVNASERLGDIEYEEQGKGFFHLDNEPFGIAPLDAASLDELSDSEQTKILNMVHSNRWFEDLKFFSEQIANWDKWIEAITNNHKYKTKKLDTQPDEFFFNVGGYSGRFSYNMNDTLPPIIFPFQEGITIKKYESGGDISGFNLRTPDGKEYIFGDTLGTSFNAVDFTENTNYYLPTFYTYPETGGDREKFLEAQVEVAQLSNFPFIGNRIIATYGNSYDRNYRKMAAPRFSSSWHLVKVNSLLTEEEVEFIYEKDTLCYYADKSYSHTFPNFGVDSTNLTTTENEDLNPRLAVIGDKSTKWENGRAEFTYSATQTTLERYDLKEIRTDRGESAHFIYQTPRGEIAGDYLCDSIIITRGSGSLFKGWKLFYETDTAEGGGISKCIDVIPDSQGVQTIMPGDALYALGSKYQLKHHEYNNYFHINFSLYCLSIPLRLNFGYAADVRDWGYTSQLAEFGSLADVKKRLHEFDKPKEEAIYNAEHQRSFLVRIEEVDKTGALHDDFVSISYMDGTLPKRFSIDQDLMGYYNSNSTGSPLPPIQYTAINDSTITTQTSGIKRLFGFYHEGFESNFFQGHDYSANLGRAQIGALEALEYGSGGRIAYSYASNKFPFEGSEIDGAGIRVASLTEDPSDMPPKITYYAYSEPHVINDPIRIEQDTFNFYYPSLEQKVMCSSAPLNPMFSNKSNHVGYKKVMEYWKQFGGDGAVIGRVVHLFTTPDDYGQIIQDTSLNEIGIGRYEEHKVGMASLNSTFDYTELNSLPPSLRFPQEMEHIGEFMGLEYQTEVYNVAGDTIQLTQNNYQYFGTDCNCGTIEYIQGSSPSESRSQGSFCEPSLTYFQSGRYQYNFPGDFWENYFNRVIPHYRIFTEKDDEGDKLVDVLLDFLSNLLAFDFNAIDHPYKYIDRNTYVSQRCIKSGNVRLTESTVENFFENGTRNKVENTYSYSGVGTYIQDIPKTIETKTFTNGNIDQGKIKKTNIFAHNYPSYYDDNTIDYLKDINYKIPIYSKTEQGTALIQSDFTALTMDNGKVVPKANFTARDGVVSIVGAFEDYSDDGKPQKYFIAKHGTDGDDYNTGSLTEFFDSIALSWNDQLQMTSRKYKDFETAYTYDPTYYTLTQVVDPDSIKSTYGYDNRWRLDSVTTLNGRQTIDYEYNIAQGDNYIKSILSFEDETFDAQESTQFMDGFGRLFKTTRDNDGAILSSIEFDHLFRISETHALGKGTTSFTYDHSPITRKTIAVDAVGNKTITVNTGDGAYFAKTEVTDPNGHKLTTWSDGLGNMRKRKSGEPNGVTKYKYDNFNRLDTIISPDDEIYAYDYNEIDRVKTKKIPGAGTKTYWWDSSFRPAAAQDAAGNRQVMHYDDYSRLTVVLSKDGTIPGDSEEVVTSPITGNDTLLQNTYVANHSWLKGTKERIILNDVFGEYKSITYAAFDDIGRPGTIETDYPDGSFSSTPTYTDAGLITHENVSFEGPESFDYVMKYTFDEILRPSETRITFAGETQRINKLFYNGADQVTKKYLGGAGFAPLQKVDYQYDAIGRLIQINNPSEMECFDTLEVCDMEIILEIPNNTRSSINPNCRFLTSIEIDGNTYNLSQVIDLYDDPNDLLAALEAALDALGYFGEVSIDVYPRGGVMVIVVNITNTNAEEIILHYQDCQTTTELDVIQCCENQVDSTLVHDSLSMDYSDLYYQYIEYTGLDINRIEIGSDCSTGFLRNDYTYDADHRVDTMINTLFNPDPTPNVYNTTYSYTPGGNITQLTRNGLISIDTTGVPTYGLIDSLIYFYISDQTILSRLKKVEDKTPDAQAQPRGFFPTTSNYGYSDNNGNITSDDGKGLDEIDYNLLNLPMSMLNNTSGEKMFFDYTYGAEKTKKLAIVQDTAGLDTITRLYIGGFEFVDGEPEAFNTAEGRINLRDTSFQFRIADHLGNTVVLFEDKNDDGTISTSIPQDPDSAEVLQRNLYYPFGLQLEGTWDALTDPRSDYLYNGKELEEELGLDWLSYGARMYDAAIGRWGQIDPLADSYAPYSPYNYTLNNPILLIDPDGMKVDTNYVFNEDGEFVRREDNNNPNQIVVENSKTKGRVSVQFNDPAHDVKLLEKTLEWWGRDAYNNRLLHFVSDEDINEMMGSSGTRHRNRFMRHYYAGTESDGGKMDFAKTHLLKYVNDNGLNFYYTDFLQQTGGEKRTPFLIMGNAKGTAYNFMDAGNWLWGNAMNRLGFSAGSAAYWSKWNDPNDTVADQRAISNGWHYQEGFISTSDRGNYQIINNWIR